MQNFNLNKVLKVFLIAILVSTGFYSQQPKAGEFIETNPMSQVQSGSSAVLLGDGRVVVVGDRTEIYNPVEGDWILGAPMTTPRSLHSATLLNNGTILVTGGRAGSGVLDSSEIYDPETNSWSMAGSLNEARAEQRATLLNNGKVLIAGGVNENFDSLSSAEIYDPSADTWSAAGIMADRRYRQGQTLLDNGEVLVTGGRDNSAPIASERDLASAEIYSPTTNSWRGAASMIEAHWSGNAVTLDDGRVLVAGGARLVEGIGTIGVRKTEIYDPVANSWTSSGDLNTTRSTAQINKLCNGHVLITGGLDRYTFKVTASAEIFNPSTGIWQEVGPMPQPRVFHTSTILDDCQVLIAGGQNDNAVLTSAVLYKPQDVIIVPILFLLLEE